MVEELKGVSLKNVGNIICDIIKNMKKIVLSFFIIIFTVFSASFVLADEKTKSNSPALQNAERMAGTTPLNPLYFFDRAIEDINKFFFLWSLERRYNYLQKLREERQAELNVVYVEKNGTLTPETAALQKLVTGIQADMADIRRRDAIRVRKGGVSIFKTAPGSEPFLTEGEKAYIRLVDQTLAELNRQKGALRADIEETRKNNDPDKIKVLLDQLKSVKEEYTRISEENGRYISSITRERERIEDMLTGPEMAQKVMDEIDAARIRLLGEADRFGLTVNTATMAPLNNLFEQAKNILGQQEREKFPSIMLPTQYRKFLDFEKAVRTAEAKIAANIQAKEMKEMGREELAEFKKEEVKNITPATPAANPPLRPLGQPTPTASPQLNFLPPTIFTASIGEHFEYSFCQPAVARTSDLCAGSATNPEFGIPPYSFKQDTMGGFPPYGLILNKNGLLTGTPTTEGDYTFKVCAVDQGGFSVCQTIKINIKGRDCNVMEYGDCRGDCTWAGNLCLNRCFSSGMLPGEQQNCDNTCTASLQECYQKCEPLKCEDT